MTTEATSKEPYDFSGSTAKYYDQYMGPMYFEPYAIEVSNRIDASSVQAALELAAGTGRVTRHLRSALLPEAKLIASDISADMLAVAKEKLKGTNIDWQIIDAQDLPFENNSIDLVVCCFGLMFMPGKLKACSEVHRVLRSGGMFITTTWDKLESIGASYVYRTIAEKYLPQPLPESYDLPTSMHDESVLRELLEETGFSRVVVEKQNKDTRCRSAKDAAEALTRAGAIYNEIMHLNPAWVDEIQSLVEKELARKYGESPMIAPMSAVIAQAWK
jgi:ubiquinone/menaquinone biosynthesis C-methylase UbiE